MNWRGLSLTLAALVTVAACQPVANRAPDINALPQGVPHSGQSYRNDPEHFQFAIVGDRTGGHRAGVFRHAMEQLNWLQPEFVVSVGDFIEGYTEDRRQLDQEWDEIESMTARLQMPIIYVVGNHDISNEAMRDYWHERRGRDYYHFRYRDVLFIALNTEDPPTSDKKKAILERFGREKVGRALGILQANRDKAGELMARDPELAEIAQAFQQADQVTIGDAQIDVVARALKANQDVRWTVLLMHKPAWKYPSPAFKRIQAMLADRPHTVFAGHMHTYDYRQIDGHDYIQLGTTGGSANPNPAEPEDHVLWVTMTDKGPEVAHISLSGLHDRRGPNPQRATTTIH